MVPSLASMMAPFLQNLSGAGLPASPPTGFPGAGITAPQPGAAFDPQLFVQQQQQYQKQMWDRQLQQIMAAQAKRKTTAAPAPAGPLAGQSFEGEGPLALWRARMNKV